MSFQTPPNNYNRIQYTQYLEDQLERLSSFMLHQKKENQKNNQLMRMIEDQNQKIKIINDKIHFFEVYQHQNFKTHTKILDSLQRVPVLQRKLQKLQITLHENNYDCGNLASKPQKSHELKNEIQQIIAYEISQKFKQIQEIMNLKQERLMVKISSINKQKQPIGQPYTVSHTGRGIVFSKNSTSLRTNQTQHDRSSRVREIRSDDLINKRGMQHNQKKISPFVPEQFNKFEKQLQIFQNQKNVNKENHSLTDRNIKEKKSRSPITSYLQKEKILKNEKQYIDLNHQISKSFFSVLQKPTDSDRRNKKNIKRKRSKSKSEIKSEISLQFSNISKQNNKIKKSKKISHLKEQKIPEREGRKGKTTQLMETSEDKMKRNKSKKKSIYVKNQQNPKRTSYMAQNRLKKQNSKTSNNISQLSISQNSIKSGSPPKGSINKQLKNKKQFLMSCNKLHY